MNSYLPPQHGAWAFLGLPVFLGVLVAPWTPLLLVLTVAWVAAYPASYAALGLVRARHPQRYRRPLASWLVAVVPAVVALVAWRPWLVWVGLGYLVLFAVNLGYARRNDERAIGNDLVFVVECAAMVVVTWAVGAGERSWSPPRPGDVPGRVWVLTAICWLVMVGSTLHVKSLIRKRRDTRYGRASRAVAVGSVLASVVLADQWGWPGGAWLVLPFAVLAVRAHLVGRRPVRPVALGMIELGGFTLIAIGGILASL
jgi:hypothetical protein